MTLPLVAVERTTSLVAAAAALIAAAVATGCARSDSRQPTPVVTPSSASAQPSGFDPGFENGGRCPAATAPELPSKAGCVTEIEADVDGVRGSETVRVFASVTNGLPHGWRMVAELSDGTRAALSLDGTRDSYPMVIGAEDIDGDGRDEVFVKVLDFLFHSAGSSVVRMVRVVDGDFSFVRHAGGRPFDIQVGGVTQLGEGADCRDADGDGRSEIRLLRVTTRDHTFRRWIATARIYRWDGGSLAFTRSRKRVVLADSYNDPDVRRYYELRCHGFDPPYPY